MDEVWETPEASSKGDRAVWEPPAASRAARRALTRRRLLEGGAAAGVAGLAGAALMRRGTVSVAQQPTGGDVDLVELALTMYALEREFLERGLEAGILSGRDQEIVTEVLNLSEAQEKLISQIYADLGAGPLQVGEFRFPDEAFASRDGFLRLHAELELLWVGGFQGMLVSLQSPELFNVGAAVAGVRARVAATSAALAGAPPLPSPVEQPLSAADLLNRVAPYRAA